MEREHKGIFGAEVWWYNDHEDKECHDFCIVMEKTLAEAAETVSNRLPNVSKVSFYDFMDNDVIFVTEEGFNKLLNCYVHEEEEEAENE